MTPERAREIIEQAKAEERKFSPVYYSPWENQLNKVLKTGEREEVFKVLETMSYDSSFATALNKIACYGL